MSRTQWLSITVVIVVFGLSGFYLSKALSTQPPASDASLPSTTMVDLAGATRRLDDWHGQPVLVNFWATWCAPCLREIPLLVALQDEFRAAGLAVVGVAVDEELAVRQFVADRDINYLVLLGEENGMGAATALGADVFALPVSAVVDRDGRVVLTHTGELSESLARRAIADALRDD